MLGGPPILDEGGSQDSPFPWFGFLLFLAGLIAIGMGLMSAMRAGQERAARCRTEPVIIQVVTTREWDNWFGGPGARTAVEFLDGHREELPGKLGQPGDRFTVEREVCAAEAEP